MDVDQIADTLPHERARVTRELLAPLEQNQVEAFLSAEILLDQLLHLAYELSVLEYRQLDVEDRCFLGAGMLLCPASDLMQLLSRLLERRVEALDLCRYRFVGDDSVTHVRDFPPEKVDQSVHNAG